MNEMIRLPLNFAEKVYKQLEKYGVSKRFDKVGLLDTKFSKDELDKIKNLSFVDEKCDTKYLKYFSNLENLTIKSNEQNSFISKGDVISIKDEDIYEIEKLPNLKMLEIVNQEFITSLDISNLNKLEVLTLTRNSQLENIVGLDKNRTIEILDIYELPSMSNIKNFHEFVGENKKLQELNCDVLFFTDCIGYKYPQNIVNRKALDTIKNGDINCTWIETASNKLIKLNNSQMGKLHQKSMDIVNKYCNTNSDIENIISVERYLVENVTYNHDAVNSSLRGNFVEIGGVKMLSGPTRGANGAYDALMNNNCVCEGYTRAMQYLLKLKGINATNVGCLAKEDIYGISDKKNENVYGLKVKLENGHSICRVECDGKYYYCDATWDASRYQKGDHSFPYLLKTKSQLKSTHTLSRDEINVTDSPPIDPATLKYYKDIVERKFKTNQNMR